MKGWTTGTGGLSSYRVQMGDELRMTIAYDEPDEAGWIVARVVEVPGAASQGRTRAEARENVLDALRLMLSPDDAVTTASPDESVVVQLLSA